MKKLILVLTLLTGLAQAEVERTATLPIYYGDCMDKVEAFMEVLPSKVIVDEPWLLTTVRILTQDDKSLLITCLTDRMVIVQSSYRDITIEPL